MSAFVEVDDLRVTAGDAPILPGVTLRVEAGTTLGIVGESGSGKSMLVKALTGLLPRGVTATGSYRLGGTEVDLGGSDRAWRRIRGSRVVLVLQDPFTSLDPLRRCGTQILDSAPGGRRSRAERRADVARRLAEVGLPEHVADQYPHELSGGMRQRVAIAAALASEPEILVADEPTTALDVTTQRSILDLLAELQASRGMTLVLITHDLRLAQERCDDLAVMYAGTVVETGPADQVFTSPAHPYTRALHDAIPPVDARLDRMPTVAGSVPAATDAPGCPFAPRCPLAQERCSTDPVRLGPLGSAGEREVACLVVGETVAGHPSTGPDVPPVEPADAASRSDTSASEAPSVGPADGAKPALLRVDGLVKQFRGATARALDGVSLEVRAGESVGIVGESGSGKTTLARCVVGLERPDEGSVRVLGRDGPVNPGPRDVQIVFQDPYSALNPALSIGTMLAEAASVAPPGAHRRTVGELLRLVGLPEHYARRRPARLSGGERQRVAIARALAPAPRLLVCDESVSALDVSVQAQVLNLLADLRDELGLALLFISHDLAVVRQITDRVHVMRSGRVVESGPTETVLAAPQHPYTRALLASVPGAVLVPVLQEEPA